MATQPFATFATAPFSSESISPMMRSGLYCKRQRMPRTTVRADDVIIRREGGAGFVEVGQFAVGKDDDALQEEKSSEAEDG